MADPLFREVQLSGSVSGNKDYSEKIIGSLVNLASALGRYDDNEWSDKDWSLLIKPDSCQVDNARDWSLSVLSRRCEAAKMIGYRLEQGRRITTTISQLSVQVSWTGVYSVC